MFIIRTYWLPATLFETTNAYAYQCMTWEGFRQICSLATIDSTDARLRE